MRCKYADEQERQYAFLEELIDNSHKHIEQVGGSIVALASALNPAVMDRYQHALRAVLV